MLRSAAISCLFACPTGSHDLIAQEAHKPLETMKRRRPGRFCVWYEAKAFSETGKEKETLKDLQSDVKHQLQPKKLVQAAGGDTEVSPCNLERFLLTNICSHLNQQA